jgi:sortase (surface protein transpeptidase)
VFVSAVDIQSGIALAYVFAIVIVIVIGNGSCVICVAALKSSKYSNGEEHHTNATVLRNAIQMERKRKHNWNARKRREQHYYYNSPQTKVVTPQLTLVVDYKTWIHRKAKKIVLKSVVHWQKRWDP